MKFKANSRRRALEYEKDLVQYWKQHKTFEKSVSQRPADNSYVFYDGPPFITGVPHHGTLLSSIVKDAVPRYQTMKGKRVERVWGWDCHGLPAEVFTEKKLGIHDRRDIGTKISLEEYINTARDNMVQTGSLWEDTIDRIGRWVDFKGAYKTMDKEYMESIWWAFKTLYEKGKIYEGERVLMYCTRDATPLSKAEVTMDAGAYQDVTDPSAYVKFKLTQNDMTHAEIAIEKIDLESDYSRFASETGLDRQYASRLERMTKEDKAVVFAAKIGTDYVGRVTLWLDEWKDEDGGSDDDRKVPSDDYPGLPQINALQVLRAFRRRGVATALLHAAEQEAARRGFKTVGLGVGIDNSPASELYTKQGYKKYPVDQKDTYWARWQETDNSGGVRQISHECYFMLKDISRADGVYLLAWTTTPWTLPANVALAVNPDLTYVEVEYAGERLILAKDLVGKVLTNEKHQVLEHTLTRELKGGELVGLEYEPLFEDRGAPAHRVLSADFVSAEEGTGIVHIAPAYGEDDFNLAREHDLPVVHTIDENGLFTSGDWAGENVWEINKMIAKTLLERGVAWKIEYIRHPYPHCHRCGTRLMYRAHPSWFMDIEGQREEMLARNTEEITWFPEHIKHGRFEKNIQAAPDWNLSRDRFWATAMPVWEGVDAAGNKQQIVVGSYAELKELSGVELEDYHRPWIDAVEFDHDGVHYKRIDKVIDGWFESGSMPFAQFHYPFENKEKFEANFPGDFIAEYVGQVRAWFYYLHAVNVGLFGKSAFKNVIVTGTLAGNDGRKMSKSYGNFTDPNELMDTYSADSLRFLLLSSPVLNAEDFSLQDKDVGDVARKLSMIWNMYDFFTMYAEVDNWEWNGDLSDPSPQLTNPLDQWVVSRVHQLTQEVEQRMDRYDIPSALKPVLPFIEDASNWYVRRSRRRFWKSEDDTDKNNAYRTLHYVLVQLSQVLAPFTPFLAEELYRKLTGGESVHLLDWPRVGHVNELLLDEMDSLRDFVQMGLSERAIHKTKIRQPLRALTYYSKEQPLRAEFEEILKDELNVHEVIHSTSVKGLTELSQIVGRVDCSVELDLVITPELRREGVMREVIRHVQAARKNAGLNVDDRIHLVLTSGDEELQRAIIEHKPTIMAETLALELADTGEPAYTATVQIDGSSLTIGLEKA